MALVTAGVRRAVTGPRPGDPAYRLVTLVLIRAGLRVTDALSVSRDFVVFDADRAPYLRYLNHKMKREALVRSTNSSTP